MVSIFLVLGLGWLSNICWILPRSSGIQVAPRQRGLVSRDARVDGPYGVLPEEAAPLVQLEEPDFILEVLIKVVQAADKKRGVDMSAFWVEEGNDIVVMITGLSRPQLQAIAYEIDQVTRKELRIKRMPQMSFGTASNKLTDSTLRDMAASGWVLMRYPRITINIMTPSQRSYYNIEAIWRDDNEDYEKIPLDEILREAGFGSLRITRELQDPNDRTPPGFYDDDDAPEADWSDDEDEQPLYDPEEEDPFWS